MRSRIVSKSVTEHSLARVMDGDNEEAWGYYADGPGPPRRMCSANYNYYGSSHLQQFPHYACDCDFFQVPGPSSRTEKSKAWEPSNAASDDEDCVELQVSLKLI